MHYAKSLYMYLNINVIHDGTKAETAIPVSVCATGKTLRPKLNIAHIYALVCETITELSVRMHCTINR